MALPTNSEIVGRMMEALRLLKDKKVIRGYKTFLRDYDINEGNFWHLQQDHSRKIFDVAWLAILVIEYNVSAHWLLTGEGDIFEAH